MESSTPYGNGGYAAGQGYSARRGGNQGAYPTDDAGFFEQVPVGAGFGSNGEKKKKRHIAGKVIGVLIAIVALVYLAGVFYFGGHFLPKTTIGDVDVSLMSYSDAKKAVADYIGDYQLTIEGDGFNLTLSANQGGFNFDSNGVVNQAASNNNAWQWPLGIMRSHDETSKIADAASTEGLEDIVTKAVNEFNQTATPSEDASISYNESTSSFEVKSETYGSQLDVDKVLEAARTAITNLEPKVELSAAYTIRPTRVSTDSALTTAVSKANDMINVNCTLVASGNNVEMTKVTPALVGPMIVLGDDLNPTLSQDAVNAWAQQVADAFSTVGKERSYTRPNGKQVTVSGGDYGWETDDASLAEALNTAISTHTAGTVEVNVSAPGNGYVSATQDFGAYVDVDLTEQHAYYYDANGNLLWDAGIVSGKPDGENDTPTGVWYLKGKQTNVTLIGQNNPETHQPTYQSPVSFWMPFIGNSYGLHDASWQPSWVFSDATAYKTYGSHGCVNLTYDSASALYNLVQYGDPVIVHW